MTTLHGWGRYPRSECALVEPNCRAGFAQALSRGAVIARGMGRSYGDSALGATVLSTRYWNHLQAFDEATGILRCAAGVTLDDIVRTYAPRGWFLPVTPGTRFVSVGGAIASDVHGKNHHRVGTFTEHVLELDVLLGDGQCVTASRTNHPDLFHATCSGMGLTGVILAAAVQLTRIPSCDIVQSTLKLPNLEAALAAFEEYAESSYTVAWIDSTARGAKLGRSILYVGEHDPTGSLSLPTPTRVTVPLEAPSWLTSGPFMRAFNRLYYMRARTSASTRRMPLTDYFYPLDSVLHWNRLYGSNGLVQYQFVLPLSSAARGLREMLQVIGDSRLGSCLAVLKRFGPSNANLLSFPMEGYTLAVDFLAGNAQLALLERLDSMVLDYGGRIYLAKDARMSRKTFQATYPRWHEFEDVRARWHAHGRFASEQGRRIGFR